MYEVKRIKGSFGQTIGINVVSPDGKVVRSYSLSWNDNPLSANSSRTHKAIDAKMKEAKEYAATLTEKAEIDATSSKSGGEINLSHDGLYHTKDGKAFSTYEEAQDHLDTVEAKGEFESDISEFEDRIRQAGAKREALASRISARKQGQLMNQLQRSILGTGGEQAQVEAIVPRVQESSQRNLIDYITQSQGKTAGELAKAKQFEIKGDFDLEGLGLKRDALTDAMAQFIMGEETDRARIQASIDMQPEWWEVALQQLAGGFGQGVGRSLGLGA